jgi:predicted transcriptional regulator
MKTNEKGRSPIREDKNSDPQHLTKGQDHDLVSPKTCEHVNCQKYGDYPVDVQAIARELDIKVRIHPEPIADDVDYLAFSTNCGNKAIIIFRKMTEAELREALAHFLGHLATDFSTEHAACTCIKINGEYRSGTAKVDFDCQAAQAYADRLLMPDVEIREAVAKHGAAVELLARLFGVTEAAVARRLETL